MQFALLLDRLQPKRGRDTLKRRYVHLEHLNTSHELDSNILNVTSS